jgi:hypothetical protein
MGNSPVDRDDTEYMREMWGTTHHLTDYWINATQT